MSRVEMAEQLAQQLPATRNLHESLSRAEELAIRRKHSVVGLDHLLLALGQDPDAVAILLACNVDVEALCMDLLRKLGPEARMISPNAVPPTFDVIVQNLIAHASAAAQKSGQTEIGSPNILSAIISGEGGMITHKILQRHGLTFDEAISTLNRVVPTERKGERKGEKPAQKTDNHQEDQHPPQNKPEQSKSTQNPRQQQPERRSENNSDMASRHLNADLKKDDVLKGSSPDLTNNILDDTIIQAEAHPSDYGVTEDGSEDHPVPPQHWNNNPSNQAPVSKQGPNVVMKTGPKFSGENMPGAPVSAKSPLPHSQSPHPNADQLQSSQSNHHPDARPEQRPEARGSIAPQAPKQQPQNPQEAQAVRQGPRFNFGASSFSPVPFNPPHNRQQGSAENDTNNGSEFSNNNEQAAKSRQSGNQGLPPLPPQKNLPQQGMPAPVSPIPGTPVPGTSVSGTPAPNPHHLQSPHQPLPPHDQQATPAFLQNKQSPGNTIPPHQGLPNQGIPARQAPAGQQLHKNVPPVNQETVDELASSIRRSQANLSATDTQDQVIENIPKVMRVGKMHFVEVRVARFTSAELDFGNENFGLRAKPDKGPVTKAITVRLTGPDGQFLIDSSTASTQWTEVQSGMVDDVDFAIWRWRVMPRRKGISKLRLDVTVRSSSENGITAEIPVQPSKSFEIKVTRNYARIFKSFFGLVVIFALGYGISQYGHQTYQWTMDKVDQLMQPSPDE